MTKVARVIITLDCGRSCSYCCNKTSKAIADAVHIRSFMSLAPYDIICITGGEPLLHPDKTIGLVAALRKQNPAVKIFLYSALYTERMTDVVNVVDGVHFTLHTGSLSDMKGFEEFQKLTTRYPFGQKSFRLYINPSINKAVSIIPMVWARVEAKPWLLNCGLPENETLFILEG